MADEIMKTAMEAFGGDFPEATFHWEFESKQDAQKYIEFRDDDLEYKIEEHKEQWRLSIVK